MVLNRRKWNITNTAGDLRVSRGRIVNYINDMKMDGMALSEIAKYEEKKKDKPIDFNDCPPSVQDMRTRYPN